MKKTITTFLFSLLPCMLVMANVNISFPDNFSEDSVKVSHQMVRDIVNACNNPTFITTAIENLPVTDGEGYIVLTEESAARYCIEFDNGNSVIFYAEPSDMLHVEISSTDPLIYSVSGSELNEGWSEFERANRSTLLALKAISSLRNPSDSQIKEYRANLYGAVKKYVEDNPESPSAVAVLMLLKGQEYMDTFALLGKGARNSILFPLAQEAYIMEIANTRVPVDDMELAVDIE